MATVKNRNPPFLKVIFSLSVDIMNAKTQMYYEEKQKKRTMKKYREQKKKHNKRKIKNLKKWKNKNQIFYFPLSALLALSSFVAPSSPAHALSLSRVFVSLLCSFVRFGRDRAVVACVCSLHPAGVRSVLVNPKLIIPHCKRECRSQFVLML